MRAEPASTQPESRPAPTATLDRLQHAAWALSLFLVLLGAKYFMLHRAGTALPFWDQWDGEAGDLYIPFLEGRLHFADLFRAHNEHRILFTRLLDLVLLRLNGQWDNLFQAAVNAVLHSAAVAGLAALLARLIGKQFWPVVWAAFALAAAPPFAWENTVGGFQSQFYFLLLFSWLAIWWLGLCEPLSWRWWLGVAAGLAALFTTASGVLAAATAGCLALFEVLKDPRGWRRAMPTLVAAVIVAAIGVLIFPGIQRSEVERAHSIGEFLNSLGQNLAWPWVIYPQCALINLLPLAALAWMYFRSPEKRQPAQQLVLALGLWVFLQATATALGRGGERNLPASRYMDSLGVLFVAEVLAITLLVSRYAPRLTLQAFWIPAFGVWLVVLACGWLWLLDVTWSNSLPVWRQFREGRLQAVRYFKYTGNPRTLEETPFFFRPFPRVNEFVQIWRNPGIQRILPACVREPLRVERGEGGDASFMTNACAPFALPAERCWGSFTDSGAAGRGKFESAILDPPRLPYLEFTVAGDLGSPGLSLEMVDVASGRTSSVVPAQSAGGWREVQVKSPSGKFKIAARDDSEEGWFAFKEPREMGRFSYWTIRVVNAWPGFAVAGLLCLSFPAGLDLVNYRRAASRAREARLKQRRTARPSAAAPAPPPGAAKSP